jgi:hypothetical protein
MAAKLRAIKSNLGARVSTLGSLNGSKTAKKRAQCFDCMDIKVITVLV